MPLDKSKVRKILIVSLTNIGDVLMTFPVVDILINDFPQAEISLIVGPKAKTLFQNNPYLKAVHVFDKNQNFIKTFLWGIGLRKQNFDLVVDLKNSFMPVAIAPRYKTALTATRCAKILKKHQHLKRLRTVYTYARESDRRYALFIPPEDKTYVQNILKEQIGENKNFAVISPGSASPFKRWPKDRYAVLADELMMRYQLSVVFVGDGADSKIVEEIMAAMKTKAVNLCGKTTLTQLAQLIDQCTIAIGNDSAAIHMASYLDKPVLTIFGPSDYREYGPWSSNSHFISSRKLLNNGELVQGDERTTIQSITTQQVLDAFVINKGQVIFKKP